MVSTALIDTITRTTEQKSQVFTRTFPASLEVFDGHYPGFPIVPGVLLVEACAAAVERVHARLGHWAGVRSARFLSPVRPEADVVITVTDNPRENGDTDYKCTVTSDGKPACTATLTYSEIYVPGKTADVVGPGDGARTGDIKKILPHRTPILLVDRVESLTPGESIVARKAVSANEPFYRELPTTQAFPWSLMMESWCQSAGVLVSTEDRNPDVLAGDMMLFGGMRGVEFHQQAYPGDVLIHHAKVERMVDGTAVMSGQTFINQEVVMTVGNITLARRPATELTGH